MYFILMQKGENIQIKKMRKRFEQQTTLRIVPIPEVQINNRTRHELPNNCHRINISFQI